jgi:ABC-type Zn uptake system ZnuABC Zn-binding protein ZnuA
VADLDPEKLKGILDQLDAVCAQARELQKQVKRAMAEAARRDYPASPPAERRKDTRKH